MKKRKYIKVIGAFIIFFALAIFITKTNNMNNLRTNLSSSQLKFNIALNTHFNKELGNIITSSSSLTLVKGTDLIANSTNVNDMKSNTRNLQNAIDKMSESGGGTIYLPSGTYYFYQGGTSSRGEKYVIRLRNNVAIVGAGTNENSTSQSTILKPYYNDPEAHGGMDMFYFNNYSDTGYNTKGNVTTSTTRDVTYTDMNGKKVTLKNQTVYLINADFSNFVIDGSQSKGGINKCGGTYQTDGKGFMINLFKDCDWDNVVVKNTDATGFGVDCPINSTINNCKAINCGKAATTSSEGGSGFGIGTGYSNDESIIITNSVAINNKKFGFFFEHQARFTGYYPATTSKGFVVANSIAGGNLYDFGGLKSFNLTYENVKSISGQGTYSHSYLNKSTVSSDSCGYTSLKYNSSGAIKLNANKTPIYFSMYSASNYMINADVDNYVTDVTTNKTEVSWAINKGILPLTSSTKFSPQETVTRFDAVNALYKYHNMPGAISTTSTVNEVTNYQSKVRNIGFTDLGSEVYKHNLHIIVWAYNQGIISKDTKFNPSTNCTRAQFVTMLYRMAGSPSVSGTLPFKDVSTNSWYYKAVLWGYKVGIVKGSTSTTFMPDNPLKKYETAVLLYRYDKTVRNRFTITYNLLGGTGSNKTTYTSSTLPYTLTAPTRSGYTFMGWTGSNGAVANKNVTIKKGTTGDLVFTANWKKTAVTLSKITIKTKPNKLTYNLLDKVDTTGLVLTATYSDGSTKNISSGYTISPTILTSTGTKTITVTYNGKTTSYTVKVNAVTLSKIAIKTKPNKLTYNVGDKVDPTGLVLTVTYSDGTTKNITTGYTISPTTLNMSGTKTITVNYNGKTTSYTVQVKESATVSKIAIKTKPNKLTYNVGDKVDPTGLVLTVTYSDGTTKNITTGYTISPLNLTVAGTQTITVKHNNKTTTYTVKVKEPATVTKIAIKTKPNKLTYNIGDVVDPTGLVLKVTYSDGTTKNITTGYTISPMNLTVAGNQTITVKHNNKTTTYTVKVNDIKLSKIAIKSKPSKLNYEVGEKIETTGLVLTATYSDGTTKSIKTGYSITPISFNSTGTKTVNVTYGGKSTSFNVNVTSSKENQPDAKIKSISIKNLPNQTSYFVGDSFTSEGLTLTATYNTGEVKEIKTGYTLSIKDGTVLNKEGTNKVTVSYNGLKTSFEIKISKVKENSLIIISKPNKTTYLLGEQFDSEGLTLEYIDENGNKSEVKTGYTLSLNDRTILRQEGSITVTVTYNNKTAEFTIEVLKIKSLTVKEGTFKTTYKIGESFDSSNLILIVEYTNGNTEEIASGYEIEDGDKFTVAGSKTITIRYGNSKTTININVTDDKVEEQPEQPKKPNDSEEPKKEEDKSSTKVGFIHVLVLTIIGLGVTLFFEYKRTH